VSFAELDHNVDNAVAALRERGVAPASTLASSPRTALGSSWLCMRSCASRPCLCRSTRLTPAEIDWQSNDADLQTLLDERRFAIARSEARNAKCARFRSRPAAQHHLTSGTTGRPKAPSSPTQSLVERGRLGLNLGLHADDRWLACLPLFHVGGLSILLRSVIYGMTAVVHARFDPAAVNDAIDTNGVTIVSVVSTMLDRVLADRGQKPFPRPCAASCWAAGRQRCPCSSAPSVRGRLSSRLRPDETASQIVTLAPEDA